MAEPQKVVVFDFDGTLADSAPIIRAIYSELAVKNKWPVLSDEIYSKLRKGSLRDAQRWSGVSIWQFPLVVRSVKKLMKLEAEKVKLFPGVVEMINMLHSEGIKMYVLSRNSSDTIDRVLERNELEGILPVLTRRKRTFGSKAAVLRKLTRLNHYDKKYVWMVGDEVRDVQAAKNAGVNSVAVTWGIQDISIIERYNPTYVATTISELQKILES